MRGYAEGTSTSVEKSRGEIESILARYGAERFSYMNAPDRATIIFQAHGKWIKFVLKLPAKEEFSTRTKYKKIVQQSPEDIYRDWEQACREKWRSLALSIKAKLESVRSEITEFEVEFMAQIIIAPNGETVGEKILPQLQEATKSGKFPALQLMG